jgi:SAM-dependent methyltransferase
MNESAPLRRLFDSYPRTRPPLPPAQAARYVEDYLSNREDRASVVNRAKLQLEAWMHRQVAGRGGPGSILEVGAGTLNHVRYERRFTVYDAVEPFADLWRQSPHRTQVREIHASIHGVPPDRKYDRVISIAVLEHVEDLPAVLAACRRLLAPGGIVQAAIPSEGGLLWGLAWRLTTAVSYRLSTGLSYAPLMRHEHVNTAREIELLFQHFFTLKHQARFPLPGRHLSLYTYLEGC